MDLRFSRDCPSGRLEPALCNGISSPGSHWNNLVAAPGVVRRAALFRPHFSYSPCDFRKRVPAYRNYTDAHAFCDAAEARRRGGAYGDTPCFCDPDSWGYLTAGFRVIADEL